MRLMIVFAGLVSCVVVTGILHAGDAKHGNFGSESLQVDGVKREYRLVVPKTVDLAKPAPLVIAFHGMLIDSKDFMPVYTKLNDTAEKHKFILAYPNAIKGSWGLVPEKINSDLAMFDALVAKLKDDYKIDANRLYVLGMSNGGYFAHLVAKERSKTVAAACSHSGPLGLQTLFGIMAERKFPVLIIHGDKDNILPVDWARDNRDRYKKEGHDVKYVELKDVGHIWGTANNVNDIIWEFFREHPLKK
jgi:polyhydroxybutyrate depolymerase